MKPSRWRPGGWIAEKWHYRAAQLTRAAIKRKEIGTWIWCAGCRKYHDIEGHHGC